MPPPIPVVIAPYDLAWPALAQGHADRLREALGPALLAVHHVGSTSVAGLAAKPIIDLIPVVADLADVDRRRAHVEALGYDWHGELGVPGRRYCTLSSAAGDRLVQLHCFEAGSAHVTRHLAFRDYLRAHPQAAEAYEREKLRARDLHPNDSHAYTDEKSDWVRDLEAKALIWFTQT
jgi:GrpB-like predicted nucleotidyltransferase (UPF0157 family)